MSLEIFVENAKIVCKNKAIAPSTACINAGLSVSWLSDIENKGTRPRIDSVIAFAQYLGVTVSELLGETPNPTALSDLPGGAAATPDFVVKYNALTPQGQKEVLAFIEFKSMQEREGKE